MLRRSIVLAFAAVLVTLSLSSKAQGWGGYHVGWTHYSPITGRLGVSGTGLVVFLALPTHRIV